MKWNLKFGWNLRGAVNFEVKKNILEDFSDFSLIKLPKSNKGDFTI